MYTKIDLLCKNITIFPLYFAMTKNICNKDKAINIIIHFISRLNRFTNRIFNTTRIINTSVININDGPGQKLESGKINIDIIK